MSDTPTDNTEEEPLKDVEDYTEKELDELHYDMSEVPLYYDHG